ncbi:MAG: hypothetical protein ACOYON_08210 [Fimbriimonas sp.]
MKSSFHEFLAETDTCGRHARELMHEKNPWSITFGVDYMLDIDMFN